jgi:hypothetical protein
MDYRHVLEREQGCKVQLLGLLSEGCNEVDFACEPTLNPMMNENFR